MNPAPNFMTIADEQYLQPLLVSAQQIKRLYPGATLYIYDWGLSEASRAKLSELGNTKFIEWTLRFINIKPKISCALFLKKLTGIARLRDIVYTIRTGKVFRVENIFDWLKFEMRVYNKFLCIKDFNECTKQDFIFLDADAFLINTMPEIFEDNFDVGVTLRRQTELSLQYNNCTAINAGVIFFLGGYAKNASFIHAWGDALAATEEVNCEQTALSRMLHATIPTIFDRQNARHEMTFGGTPIAVQILPCEIYNFNWIEEFDAEKHLKNVKILHFKSGRFNTPLFKRIAAELNL